MADPKAILAGIVATYPHLETGCKEVADCIDELETLLDRAANGLEWWMDEYPAGSSEADEQMLADIRATLKEAEPALEVKGKD